MQVPFFVGTTMVELSLIAASKWQAEGVKGFSVIPLLPNSGSVQPAMVQWEKAWRREYTGAPVGRPGALPGLAIGRRITASRLHRDRQTHLRDRAEEVALHIDGQRS